MSARWVWAAVALPLVGLGAMWAQTELQSRQGTDWDVPIEGYDPRDLLRGHYIQFTYDWPDNAAGVDVSGEGFCLIGTAPLIERIAPLADGDSCAHPIRRDRSNVYGRSDLTRGRLYVPQTQAGGLEEQLMDRDLRAIVTIRQRDDGSFTARDIRFRPLTADETAERDAQRTTAGEAVATEVESSPDP